MAENLSNKARDENWNSVQLSQESLGLCKFQDAAKPCHRSGELPSVNRCKAEKCVEASVGEMWTIARSTKSGLRLWRSFAVDFLDYDSLATLPPKSGRDVCKYVYLFNNHGTCANYICHLRWACNNQNVNMEWDTGELKQERDWPIVVILFPGPFELHLSDDGIPVLHDGCFLPW